LKKNADLAAWAKPGDQLQIRFFQQIQIYIQNGFRVWIRGLGECFDEGKISRVSVPLPLNQPGSGKYVNPNQNGQGQKCPC
jgi:hypothetical protein